MKLKEIILALILVAATWAVYWQVKDHEFVDLDDPAYIADNQTVRKGLNKESLVWAFTHTSPTYWHPLTWLSIMADVQLLGLDPGRHHLSNVFLHTVNAFLLFFILCRMSGGIWQSFFAALLFALHPLHVESVAWATERKDVLSAFFCMLTLWAYYGYTKNKTIKRYVLALMLCSLGLMSKPMLVTVPLILFLVDFWPLGRLHLRGKRPSAERKPGSSVVSLVLEKLPFLGLALVCTLVVSILHRPDGFVGFDERPLVLRMANALVSYVVYLWQTVWPVNLAVYYHFPKSLPAWEVAGAALLLGLISVGAVYLASKRPYLLVGWLWYLVTLFPVIGLVQPGMWPATADRFTYVPLIGIFIMAGWGIPDMLGGWKHKRFVLAALAGGAVAALMVVTWQQVGVWRNSWTLWDRAMRATPANWVAMDAVANLLLKEGKFDEAVSLWREALRIQPRAIRPRSNLATALMNKGQTEEAIVEAREVVRRAPASPMGHFILGRASKAQGRLAEAREHYERALEVEPGFGEARYRLAILLVEQGDLEQAVSQYREVLRRGRGFAELHYNLGVALGRLGRTDEAISQYREALQDDPAYTGAELNLGILLGRQGKIEEALSCYRKVLSIKPDSAEAHYQLGSAYAGQGKRDEALQHYRTLQGLKPPLADALLRKIEAVP